MRTVLARTAREVVPGAPTSFRIFYRDDVLSLSARQLRGVRRQLLRSGQRRNQVARRVADELIDALWSQVSGDRALERGRDEFARTMHSTREFTDFAEAWWPVVDAVDVLSWLSDRERLARDAEGVLEAAEIDDLVESLGRSDFSIEDVPLIDELRYLLGEPPEEERELDPLDDLHDELFPELSTFDQRARRAAADGRGRPTGSIEDDSYAHVLVDEAQDLSPMQWRMLGRRGRWASWTVVGDPAQSAWARPAEAAAARAEALAGKDENHFRLSTNYRNSAEIFELAAEVARARIPDADLPNAVRRTGVEPRVLEVELGGVASSVRNAVDEMADVVEGTIAVVAPVGRTGEAESWLDGRVGGRVCVLEALDTKGLEFDGIVVVEPDEIVAESPAGVRTLYVVLTRATQQLDIVGSTHRWRP